MAAIRPHCCRFCGATSLEKKLQVCSRCHCVCYCSPNCQRADWPHHKRHCAERTPELAAKQKEERASVKELLKETPMDCPVCGRKNPEPGYGLFVAWYMKGALFCSIPCYEEAEKQRTVPHTCCICGAAEVPEYALKFHFAKEGRKFPGGFIHFCCSKSCKKKSMNLVESIDNPAISKTITRNRRHP